MTHIGVMKRNERLHAGYIARGGGEQELRDCTALLLLSTLFFAEQETSVPRRGHIARSACWPASVSRPLFRALAVHHHQRAAEVAAIEGLTQSLKAMAQLPGWTQRQRQVMMRTPPAAFLRTAEVMLALDLTWTYAR